MPRTRRSQRPHSWYESLKGVEVGDYVLDQFVGKGRIGYVYRAQNKTIREITYAIKLIPGTPRLGWENEIRKVAKLSTISGVVHFHHISTYQVRHRGQTDIGQYTVWDFIAPGRDLRRYLKETPSCTASFLVAILEQVLRVLHACAAKGVPRHGDLHAGNVLIGNVDDADLDVQLQPRQPIYVSDFGYGSTGGHTKPKDDYHGLAEIADLVLERVDWEHSTTTDRQIVLHSRELVAKLLRERLTSERATPLQILDELRRLKTQAQISLERSHSMPPGTVTSMNVGSFQISEMLGEDWESWKRLFVPSVPARSRILDKDIATVVTGPRGCGKTMLFRRLSERLVLECGPVEEGVTAQEFFGLYVNANDIADAFAFFPASPSEADHQRLLCYANLCILTDVLAVQAARCSRHSEAPSPEFLALIKETLFGATDPTPLLVNEDALERFRQVLEQIKWHFSKGEHHSAFRTLADLAQARWLARFLPKLRRSCPWLAQRPVFLFFDDYTTPRVTPAMQRVLNRTLFLRSSEYLVKVATESATTFVGEDSSGKILQDGDDYRLIDMAEESLFMTEREREVFLSEVFSRRLAADRRVPPTSQNLDALLGRLPKSKTAFARQLRLPRSEISKELDLGSSQRRGPSKPRALYYGTNVFVALWSGDTRTMIQLMQNLLDEASSSGAIGRGPLDPEIQDRVFRVRGGQWLESQTRNQPTDSVAVGLGMEEMQRAAPTYHLTGGSYGAHLKAIVESFVYAAKQLLHGPMYEMREGIRVRHVPRMAFRIEVTDTFRLNRLATEIYKDLVRYGLFLRDARGKSIRGAIVPRLYLRRILLPFATLALSKRDSVPMECEHFQQLLLEPDVFQQKLEQARARTLGFTPGQLDLFPLPKVMDALYDDVALDEDHSSDASDGDFVT